ncbi:MAG: DNA topoisomerase IV subunit A [Zetaproteobacteria bacterium CG_4_9_14_3_um_filter_54_145]|nr:MAG: DNA topoisomerase IV subunit A [Zetaproteobacteria bacterium CG_4_10_14_3_um_filter_54_28]PJA28157.1 MAG: DNA topoisomerase IV subunit A [Zetaproteobacteria bacterium CG_4_9_14_3_um_filter_54_145]
MSADYDIDSIKDLDGIAHIQLRPNMYSDTSKELGCHHIAQEVLDNCGDEAIGGFCSRIIVELESDNVISITDNGRGIPVKANAAGMSGVELVLTKDKAGGKFDHDAYKVSGGLHGVGITVTNALSSWLEATVKRDGGEFSMRFENGRTVEKLKQIGVAGPRTHGTKIRFSPNPRYYESPRFRVQQVRQQAMDKAILIPGLEVIFRAPGLAEESFCFKNGLSEFMTAQMEGTPVFEFTGQLGDMEKVHWHFASFEEAIPAYVRSYANTIPTTQGGTHEKGFQAGLIKAVREYIDMRPELKKALGRSTRIAPSDVMANSQLGLSVYIQDISFKGQTKQELTSAEASKFVGGVIHDSATLWLNRDAELSDAWVKLIIDRATARAAAESGKAKKVDRKTFTGRTPLPGKLLDCRSNDIEHTELYLVEGDSAGGSAKQANDRDLQAIFPLKGKILNCEGVTSEDAGNSEAVADLITAIGTGIGEHCDIEKRRYGKIVVMTDADIDGSHIQTLLFTFFWRQMRPMVEAGRVYIVQPPLYGATIGKQKHYAQSEDELDGLKAMALAEGKKIEYIRYKGLGEMNPPELKETCMDYENRVLIQVSPEDARRMDALMTKLMGDDAGQRRDLLMGKEIEDAEFVKDPCDVTDDVEDVTACFKPYDSGQNTIAPFETVFRELYRSYGLKVVGDRAIPDVRDGMKPVHRRILYAMEMLKLRSNTKTKKSARVVGDVIGKYHPHGDSAVYGAMVRMAQPWVMRYPLIDGQGNFGSIDGDSAAAMRYTEARMTPIAEAILSGDLKEGITMYQPNYDDQDKEPMVLPAPFPLVMMNSSTGNPAVGFKTEIPSHNLTELLGACIALAKKRGRTGVMESPTDFRDVRKHITAPDFPGGGIIANTHEELEAMYAKGYGKMLLRSKWHVEHLPKGLWQIVVTEIPYGIEKSPLLIEMGARVSDKTIAESRQLPMIDDLRDESSAEDGIRIVLFPKSRNLDPDQIMLHLFSATNLQVTIQYATYALEKWHDTPNGERYRLPSLFPLDKMIRSFLDYRQELVMSRARVRLAEIMARLHILDGLLLAYPNIRDIVEIILDNDEPRPIIMEKYSLTEIQTDAILAIRLSQLRKLEQMKLQGEHDRLSAEAAGLHQVLDDDAHRWKHITGELRDALKKFGDERRTIVDPDAPKSRPMSREQIVSREPVTAILSKQGWLKGMRGSSIDVSAVRFRESDKLLDAAAGHTTDQLILIGRTGRAFSMLAADLPGGRGNGEPVSKHFIFSINEAPTRMVMIRPDAEYLVATTAAHAFRALGSDMVSANKKGKAFINFPASSKLLCIREIEAVHDAFAFIDSYGRMAVIRKEEFPLLGKGKGLTAITMKKGTKGLRDAAPITVTEGIRVGTEKRATTITAEEIETEYLVARAKAPTPLPMAAVNGMVVC